MITAEKVSDITVEEVAAYVHENLEIDSDGTTERLLDTFLKAAIGFVKSYTNRDEEYLDKYSEFVQVVFVLCQDMYDNRTLYPDKTNLNYFVKATLDMHVGGLVS